MAQNESSRDKAIVKDGYDKMAQQYADWKNQGSEVDRVRYTQDIISHLPSDAKVLEIGCGAGVPVLKMLLKHASTVLANDISTGMIELSKASFPSATYLPGDMTTLDIDNGSLDAVLGFFSILHLPRDEQPNMLSRIRGWLKEGGVVAFNLASMDNAEIRGNFFGQDMFWSGFDVDTSKQMVKDAGFEVLRSELLGVGEDVDPSDPDYGKKFLWFLVKKPEAAK